MHCYHECASGCAIHGNAPRECKGFVCPYLKGDDIHRPDAIQSLLERMGITLRCFIPWIPTCIPLAKAKAMIEKTRSILCAVNPGQWQLITLKLDQSEATVLSGSDELRETWQNLWNHYAKSTA